MSDQGAHRSSRAAPSREMTGDLRKEGDDQLDLLDEQGGEDQELTPEQQADEHKRQITELQRKADAETARATAAEQKLQTATVKVDEAQRGAFSAQEKAIDGQIDANRRIVDQAKTAMRAAREAGDFEAEEAALDQLTDAKAALQTYNNQKQYIEQLKTQQPKPEQQPSPDQYRGPHGYSRASEDWITQHPQFDSDPEFKTSVIQAAQAALATPGITADSYGFFKFLDDVVAKRYGQNRQQDNPRRGGPRGSSVAVGQSRDGNSGRQQQNGGANPAQIAQKLGVTVDDLTQFAKIARMPLEKYVAEQALILEEESRGQNTGLYRGES